MENARTACRGKLDAARRGECADDVAGPVRAPPSLWQFVVLGPTALRRIGSRCAGFIFCPLSAQLHCALHACRCRATALDCCCHICRQCTSVHAVSTPRRRRGRNGRGSIEIGPTGPSRSNSKERLRAHIADEQSSIACPCNLCNERTLRAAAVWISRRAPQTQRARGAIAARPGPPTDRSRSRP
jgi:hypothetical protein